MPERPERKQVPQGVGEEVWIQVIQKMDEVYNDLLQYEVALEEKNAALEQSQRFIVSVLGTMSDILLVCARDGTIEDVNDSLVRLTGRCTDELRRHAVTELAADEASRAQMERLLVAAEGVH